MLVTMIIKIKTTIVLLTAGAGRSPLTHYTEMYTSKRTSPIEVVAKDCFLELIRREKEETILYNKSTDRRTVPQETSMDESGGETYV